MPPSGSAATEVEELLAGLTPEVRALTLSARKLVRSVLPRCQEIPDKGARVIGYGYGPEYRDAYSGDADHPFRLMPATDSG